MYFKIYFKQLIDLQPSSHVLNLGFMVQNSRQMFVLCSVLLLEIHPKKLCSLKQHLVLFIPQCAQQLIYKSIVLWNIKCVEID